MENSFYPWIAIGNANISPLFTEEKNQPQDKRRKVFFCSNRKRQDVGDNRRGVERKEDGRASDHRGLPPRESGSGGSHEANGAEKKREGF